jgi:hypothetical protein
MIIKRKLELKKLLQNELSYSCYKPTNVYNKEIVLKEL